VDKVSTSQPRDHEFEPYIYMYMFQLPTTFWLVVGYSRKEQTECYKVLLPYYRKHITSYIIVTFDQKNFLFSEEYIQYPNYQLPSSR
jgi:hypothetical protein